MTLPLAAAARRDRIARQALEISRHIPRARALEEIADRFGCSDTTARNLISRGKYLAAQEPAQ